MDDPLTYLNCIYSLRLGIQNHNYEIIIPDVLSAHTLLVTLDQCICDLDRINYALDYL
jgi:hypothetical protein